MKKNIFTLSLLIAAAFMARAVEAQESVTLFAHGLGGHKRKLDPRYLTYYLTNNYGEYLEKTGLDCLDQIIFYQKNGTIEKGGVSFPTYTVTDPKNPLANCSLGQTHELDNAEQAMATITENNPDTNIVFRGVSLGASTGINFAGTRPELLKKYRVKGGIFESPFAHVRHVINNFASGIPRILPSFLLKPLVRNFGFPNHDLTGIQPITSAATIPHDFPVLIITSKEDTLIPWQSSKAIYDECVKSGHKQAHFLLVDHGPHAGICFSEECACDGRKCSSIVLMVEHAFRKKYNLGNYDDRIAEWGQRYFEQTQPPLPASGFSSSSN